MFSVRVSVHRTGRPTSRASHATRMSSGAAPPFGPKPPPTSGTRTRICEASMPRAPASASRVPCGVCVVAHCVRRPSSPHSATATRHSIGHEASRWLVNAVVTTTSQPSNSASSGLSFGNRAQTFVPTSGKSSASPASAVWASATTGSSSTSTMTRSAASGPWRRSSVSTTATISPANRATSLAITGRGICSSRPGIATGSGLSPMSAAVNARAPGISDTALVSMPVIRACGRIERTNVACSAPCASTSSPKVAVPVMNRGPRCA